MDEFKSKVIPWMRQNSIEVPIMEIIFVITQIILYIFKLVILLLHRQI